MMKSSGNKKQTTRRALKYRFLRVFFLSYDTILILKFPGAYLQAVFAYLDIDANKCLKWFQYSHVLGVRLLTMD